ncbi:MAG: CDP-alcohol phosphatidyltransferase family protein [Jatrophihabitantaceae bacterium]
MNAQPSSPTAVVYSATQRRQAWAVHVFTSLGMVAAVLALRDILTDHPDYAILWLLVTLLIDGVDGPIARAMMVSERVPRIDGYVLDLIIDYVTCVVVPAAFMYEFGVVPRNNFGIAVLGVMVFSSAIWFSRTDMMTEENWFRGYPAAWNLVGPLLFLMQARTIVGAIIILGLSVASLTNMPYPHVMRARFLRPVTIFVMLVWVAAISAGTFAFPDHPWLVRPPLYVGSGYFLLLSAVRAVHDMRARRGAAPGG